MTQKRTVLSTLLALVMVLGLTVPAWAGGTDVTDGTTANTYTHTYHTKVDAKATFHLKNGSTHEISHKSDFVKGNLSDTAVQDQIEIFNNKIAAYLAEEGAGLSQVSCTGKMVFDHFESSNIIVYPPIKVGDEEAASGSVSKNLDVHEYQVYTIKAEYGTPTTGGYYYSPSTPTITALLTAPDALSPTDYSGGIYGLTFRSTASFSSFRGVQVDGKTLDKSNYIAEEGSIEVYLKAVYLQTLAAGKHTVTILSTEGNATAEFTVGGSSASPKTADAGVALYAAAALLSTAGLVWNGRQPRAVNQLFSPGRYRQG